MPFLTLTDSYLNADQAKVDIEPCTLDGEESGALVSVETTDRHGLVSDLVASLSDSGLTIVRPDHNALSLSFSLWLLHESMILVTCQRGE